MSLHLLLSVRALFSDGISLLSLSGISHLTVVCTTVSYQVEIITVEVVTVKPLLAGLAVPGRAEGPASHGHGPKCNRPAAASQHEHLTHGARFLSNMGRHLEPGGRLVISTCNPFSTKRLWTILRYGHPAVHPKHTTWYDPLTLMELAARCGFAPKQLIWVQEQKGLDLRVLPRLLRRYYSGNFIIAFNLNRTQG